MKFQLNPQEESLHHRAVEVSRKYLDSEWKVIEVLLEVEEAKLYKKFELTSLYKYARKFLGLSEPTAYLLIGVARKCAEVSQLGEALKERSLTAPTAARLVSVLNRENAAELIAFARSNPVRAIDFEVARRNPRAAARMFEGF